MNKHKLTFLRNCCLFVILLVSNAANAQEWAIKKAPLMTKWSADVNVKNPLPEYPRPQLVRKEWNNLNGLWEFESGKEGDAVPVGKKLSGKILVPFPVESALSGVMKHHDRLWYRRTFTVPQNWKGKHLLLHFGAIDWESEIFINGKSVGLHKGGYDEISYDVTRYLVNKAEQELIVRVYDPTEAYGQPRGKQENPQHDNLIMYTPVTGIWQTVWIEPVQTCSIRKLKIIPDVDGNRLILQVDTAGIAKNTKVMVSIKNEKSVSQTFSGNAGVELSIPMRNPKLWSPESPFLYGLTVELKSGSSVIDAVDSYFGMRKISVEQVGDYKKIFLNNKFIYSLGFLDQGFWPDGIYTAPTDEALKFDVQIQKSFGYNMVRKHIKVEPQRWYYWADKLGIMVWQDMPSANSYRRTTPPVDTLQYRKELERLVENHFNNPSIVCWILFNETQGQKAADGTNLTQRMVKAVRAKDSSRLINAASDNIYKDYIGDILDYHSYPGPKSIESKSMATVCGEFGSVGLAVKDHEWMPTKGVSMIMSKTATDLQKTYEGYIAMLSEYKARSGMSGAVFTQLTDVEQEINGFLTYDRVLKVDTSQIKEINNKLINQNFIVKKVIVPTAISAAQEWFYTVSKPAADWNKADFNDKQWRSGKAGFGTGNVSNSVINTQWTSEDIWLRKSFKSGNLTSADLSSVILQVYADDDFEIYINGVLVASDARASSNYISIPLDSAGRLALKSNEENTIAVHCHQKRGGQFIDVGLTVINYISNTQLYEK